MCDHRSSSAILPSYSLSPSPPPLSVVVLNQPQTQSRQIPGPGRAALYELMMGGEAEAFGAGQSWYISSR